MGRPTALDEIVLMSQSLDPEWYHAVYANHASHQYVLTCLAANQMVPVKMAWELHTDLEDALWAQTVHYLLNRWTWPTAIAWPDG